MWWWNKRADLYKNEWKSGIRNSQNRTKTSQLHGVNEGKKCAVVWFEMKWKWEWKFAQNELKIAARGCATEIEKMEETRAVEETNGEK